MRSLVLPFLAGAVLATTAACSPAARPTPGTPPPPPPLAQRAALADSVRHSSTPADVDFMRGMIHHHAQALVMSRMAPSHGASPHIQVLAARIINAQRDEIALIQQWLRDHDQTVVEPGGMGMGMHGDHQSVRMPGMLTPHQLAKLDAARGPEFDRLFLTYMIQHHQGALTMVNQLFDTYGAGQGDAIFKLASDIGADQSSEIDRMQLMLRELLFETGSPQ